MRKLLVCAVLALIPSLAAAQQGYAGISVGGDILLGDLFVPLSAQAGFAATPMIDVRADLGYYVASSEFILGLNALGNLPIGGHDKRAYGGGGPRILLSPGSSGGTGLFGLGGLLGAEFEMTNQIGLFGEGGLDCFLVGGTAVPMVRFAVGANFHFFPLRPLPGSSPVNVFRIAFE